ncbi:MAG: beta-lactamase family protein [Acidobacteria bacterium]|nr:beta-lactamase family protein [Acidobacteriota bacterium]
MKPRLTLIALLAMAASCVSQVQLPGTPAGRQFANWLAAFNSGEQEVYRQFLQQNFPSRLDAVPRDMDLRERTGGFDLRKVEESGEQSIVVLVQERGSDQFARLRLELEPAEPHHIARFEARAIPAPAEFALPHLSEQELVAAARNKLQSDAAAGRFAGAALIARGGRPIFEQAYGLADHEAKIPNTLNTRFRIGSMNKMFTAVATLQLAEAGKIGLDDPLGKYLADYPNKDVAQKVTIRHLLTHTGGTGDIFTPEFEKHRLELRTLGDYVKLYGARGLLFEPGSRWDYSNYGFILLGVIIEKASGQSYYDYVRDHIYRPAGMVSTASEPEEQPVPNRSVGYTRAENGGAWVRNTDTLPYRGSSAGGGYSTVADLLAFANALEQHKLLNPRYTDMLTTGQVDTPNGRYAFGFGDRMVNGTRCYGHGGGAPGMNGELEICPAAGYVVAVLANMDPPAATRESAFITNRLPSPEPPSRTK